MKKTVSALVLAAVFGISITSAFAQSPTSIPSDHPIWSADNSTITGYISNEDYNRDKAESEARNGMHLPVVSANGTVTDDHGVTETCPFFYSMGCVDLTHTDAYIASMQYIARQLIAMHIDNQFAVYSGWIASVR